MQAPMGYLRGIFLELLSDPSEGSRFLFQSQDSLKQESTRNQQEEPCSWFLFLEKAMLGWWKSFFCPLFIQPYNL